MGTPGKYLRSEARAWPWSLKLCVRGSALTGKRLLSLADTLSFAKGRARSSHFKSPLKTAAAISLAAGIQLFRRRLPTEWNVADGLSRLRPWCRRDLAASSSAPCENDGLNLSTETDFPGWSMAPHAAGNSTPTMPQVLNASYIFDACSENFSDGSRGRPAHIDYSRPNTAEAEGEPRLGEHLVDQPRFVVLGEAGPFRWPP
jgi:hypothetical protein